MQHLSTFLAAGQEQPPPPGTEQQKPGVSSDADVCAYCDGAGFFRAERPLGDPDFGKAVPCPACHPVVNAFGVPDRLRAATFGNFDTSLNPAMIPALSQCRRVASGQVWCAALIGDIGVGKSHLAAAALAVSVHPKPGHFWPLAQLLLWMRQQMFDDRGPKRPEAEVIGFFQSNPGLLVIDDLGAEKPTEWSQQVLYSVLNARYERKLPTILTTNNVLTLDERIISRFNDGAIVCEGQDVRRIDRQPAGQQRS